MNTNRTIIRRILPLLPAALLAAAGSAHACDLAPPAAADSPRAVMIQTRADDAQSEHSWSDGTNNIRIFRKDGRVTVEFNGKSIMDIDDADLFQAELGDAHAYAGRADEIARAVRERMRQGFTSRAPMARAFNLAEAPKVMIGVTMDSAAEADAEVPAGIDPEQVTLITRVVAGLPAEKAGLKEGDLVIRVEDNSPATPDDIRDAIKDRKPGDTLRLRVHREGREQDIAITLEEYDNERLGAPRAWIGQWSGADDDQHRLTDEQLAQIEKLRAEMNEASSRLADLGRQLADARGSDRRRLNLQMEELAQKMATLGSEMSGLGGGPFRFRFAPGQQGLFLEDLPQVRIDRIPGGEPRALVIPPAPPEPDQSDDRIDQLNQRLDRLEKLLERLAEKENR